MIKTAYDIAIIHDMYVEPEFRRKGIGETLLKECIKRIKRYHVKSVRLNVLINNMEAIRFYLKHGFRPRMLSMERSLD